MHSGGGGGGGLCTSNWGGGERVEGGLKSAPLEKGEGGGGRLVTSAHSMMLENGMSSIFLVCTMLPEPYHIFLPPECSISKVLSHKTPCKSLRPEPSLFSFKSSIPLYTTQTCEKPDMLKLCM